MVRKHTPWARSRMTRTRPKTPAPKTDWVITELSRITGMTVRRLRDYVARDLIVPLERRGTATRYQRGQLVRLMAIKRFRAEQALPLVEIKHRIDAMDERELEAWVSSSPLPEAVVEALGLGAGSALDDEDFHCLPHFGGGTIVNPVEGVSANQLSQAVWYHVELLPGLVLQVSQSASAAAKVPLGGSATSTSALKAPLLDLVLATSETIGRPRCWSLEPRYYRTWLSERFSARKWLEICSERYGLTGSAKYPSTLQPRKSANHGWCRYTRGPHDCTK